MEAAAGLEERDVLETKVFACLMPAIDATRRVYERGRGFIPDEDDLKTDLAKLLSQLGSVKLMWPLPIDPFDAEVLLLMIHVLEDLNAILGTLLHSDKPNLTSEGSLLSVQLAFDAVIDVAKM
jgi:hypothetical protein